MTRGLTIEQAADALQVSTRTIYEWGARGDIHIARVGRVVRISEAEIERILAPPKRDTVKPIKYRKIKLGVR